MMHLSELFVVLIVTVLVIKPEQLPAVAVKLGRYTSWIRRSILKIKKTLDTHE